MALVLAILQAELERLCRPREVAELLGDLTLDAAHQQLTRRTEKGTIKPRCSNTKPPGTGAS